MDERTRALLPTLRVELSGLARDLGSTPATADPVPWGDAAATFRLALDDGRVLAVRWMRGTDAIERATIVAARAGRFVAAGVDVPHPTSVHPGPGGTAWLVAPWRAGRPGALALAGRAEARRLAASMGRLIRDVQGVAADGLAADRTWSDGDRLTSNASDWRTTLELAAQDPLGPRLAAAIDGLQAAWTGAPRWDLAVAHGDFAPINVLLRPDGDLTLLDLHDVAIAPRLFDIAWWGWVVRFHHPAAWAAGWRDLVRAAGHEPDPSFDLACAWVGLIRCLQHAARADTAASRARWLDRLRTTAAW